ncbi:MAG: AAA-like domain-containing protein [Pseudomonadota bacterium]
MTERFFNNAGPSVPADHYMIDPLQRIDVTHIERLIRQKRYFVLHAPRQTGKTSCLMALMHHLNKQGDYQALYTNIEAAQAVRGDVEKGISMVTQAIASAARRYLQNTHLRDWLQAEKPHHDATYLLRALLEHWSATSAQPTVLMLDEVDALVGDTLIALLRQIREGYADRPAAFPISVILCGVRDVRDYRISSRGQEVITGGSAFNIKATSLRLGNFSAAEVRELWEQHTTQTGQRFAEQIYPELWADTRGQPWLVNALGYELTDLQVPDRSVPVTLEDYRAVREKLIQSRVTHLDQLQDKLKEQRVHKVMAAVLAGEAHTDELPADDVQYVADLGLIITSPEIRIANRIYQESIPRELVWTRQVGITHQQAWYLTAQRRLDMPKLLAAFQQYFREHAEAWIERFSYKEAGPQLLLQAFLQRIVNDGGRITREYGLGRRRTDLFIEWPVDEQAGFHGTVQRIVLELKIQHGSLDATLQQGLAQTVDYADKCAADEQHLLIFDRRPEKSWQEKIWCQTRHKSRREIKVWGL